MVSSNLKRVLLLMVITTAAVGGEHSPNPNPAPRISNVTGEILGGVIGDMEVRFDSSVPRSMRSNIYNALKNSRNDYNITELVIVMSPEPGRTYALKHDILYYSLCLASHVRTNEEIVNKALSPGREEARRVERLNKWF